VRQGFYRLKINFWTGERSADNRMKRLSDLVLLVWVLILFGFLLSCKTITPSPASSGSPQTASPVSPAPPGEPQAVIKPADPPNIWWGPKPTTTEDFMNDMKKYYPDWYKWFSVYPEDIASYFSPPCRG
jgi:hypothetical protein